MKRFTLLASMAVALVGLAVVGGLWVSPAGAQRQIGRAHV